MHGWTDERRQRQAALIRTWQPWRQSTGPRTTAGKGRASRNAFKKSVREELRRIATFIAEARREEREFADVLRHRERA